MNAILPVPPTDARRREAGIRALDHFLDAGFGRIEPPVLQSGGDLSRHVRRGNPRPPLSDQRRLGRGAVPASGIYDPRLPGPISPPPQAGAVAQYSYLGPVFRARRPEQGDRSKPGSKATGARIRKPPTPRSSPSRWKRRRWPGRPARRAARRRPPVRRRAGRARSAGRLAAAPAARRRRMVATLETILDGPGQSALAQSGVLAALERADHAGAKALVEDLLAIAGIVAGRRAHRRRNRRSVSRTGGGSAPASRSRRRSAGVSAAFWRFPAIPTRPAAKLRRARRRRPARPRRGARLVRPAHRLPRRARHGGRTRLVFGAAFVRDLDYYTGFVFEAVDAARPDARPALGGGRYDGLARRLGASERYSRRRRGDLGRPTAGEGSALMAFDARPRPSRLVLAVPSKGRLQENAAAFFARAGLEFVQGRGARDYRGAIVDLPGVEVAYLSASEIVGQLAAGAAHLGVTGEDLVREQVARRRRSASRCLTPLGFGRANVVVAAPQAWIDVRTMADLEDVAATYRAQPRRADAGRDQIRQPDAPLLRRARRRRLSHRREPRRDRGRAGRRRRRTHRRHHHDRRDARRQRAEDLSTTASSCARRPISSPRSPRPGARTPGDRARAILTRIAATEEARRVARSARAAAGARASHRRKGRPALRGRRRRRRRRRSARLRRPPLRPRARPPTSPTVCSSRAPNA